MSWRLSLAVLLAASAPHVCAAADAPTSATALAEQHYRKGAASLDRGDFEAARLALVQAYALDPEPRYLYSLAVAEAKGAYPIDALSHFRRYLRLPSATDDERRTAARWMADAASKTGHVRVETAPGAAITVDSTSNAGTTPLVDPIDVSPGPHRLEATRGSQSASTTVEPHAGETVVWQLQWENAPAAIAPIPAPPSVGSGAPAPAAAGGPTPSGAAPPVPSAAAPSAAAPIPLGPPAPAAAGGPTPSGAAPPMPSAAAPSAAAPTPSRAHEPTTSGLTANGKPLPSTKWIVTAGLVGGGLLTFAIAGAVAAAGSNESDKEAQLSAQTGACPQPPMTSACVSLKNVADTHATDENVAVGFIVAGGALVVAGVLALIAWPQAKPPSTGFLAPIVAPGGGGAQWIQRF